MFRLILAISTLFTAQGFSIPALSGELGTAFEQLAQRRSYTPRTDQGPRNTLSMKDMDPDTMVELMDTDEDGAVSADEFRGPKQAFDKFDTNGDGGITKEEFAAILEMRNKRKAQAANNPRVVFHKNLPVILTHTHIQPDEGTGANHREDWESAAELAIKAQKEHNIRLSILMPTPQEATSMETTDLDALADIVKEHPNAFRLAGAGASLNGWIHAIKAENVSAGDRRKFIRQAENIIAKGAIGFGETTALHFSFFDGHPFEEIQPDHPLFLLLADLAAKHDVPLDLHIVPVAKKWTVSDELHERSRINPNWVNPNLAAFERLLAHNPKAKIIWVHFGASNETGDRTPELTRRFMRKYPNLYLSITGGHTRTRNDPLVIKGVGFNPDWLEIFTEFSDRITIGSDTFYQPDDPETKMPQLMERAITIVRNPFLPPEIARKIAFENAQKLFKLNLINADDYPLPGGGGGPDGAGGPSAQKRVQLMDSNKDGRISLAEFRGPKQNFPKIDANGDGYISPKELQTKLAMKAGKAGGPGQSGKQAKPSFGGQKPAGPGQIRVRKMDGNGDGRVARSEFKGPAKKFKKIDADANGFLTAREFTQFLRGKGKAGGQRASLGARAGAKGPMSKAEIRATITGNTLTFIAPASGKNFRVFFGADGRVRQKISGRAKIFTKKWFINKKSMLCRTYGPQNKKHCTKVAASAEANILTLSNKKFRYSAKLVTGNQVRK